MAAIGGDIKEITVNHPVLGTFTFFPKAGEDNKFDPGGMRGVDDPNMVDGGGRMIRQMNQVLGYFDVLIAKDDNTDNTMQQVADLNGSPVEGTYTVTHSNGSVWKINGAPVGNVEGNMNQGTMQLKVNGAILEKTQ